MAEQIEPSALEHARLALQTSTIYSTSDAGDFNRALIDARSALEALRSDEGATDCVQITDGDRLELGQFEDGVLQSGIRVPHPPTERQQWAHLVSEGMTAVIQVNRGRWYISGNSGDGLSYNQPGACFAPEHRG